MRESTQAHHCCQREEGRGAVAAWGFGCMWEVQEGGQGARTHHNQAQAHRWGSSLSQKAASARLPQASWRVGSVTGRGNIVWQACAEMRATAERVRGSCPTLSPPSLCSRLMIEGRARSPDGWCV